MIPFKKTNLVSFLKQHTIKMILIGMVKFYISVIT